ncbi:MAG: hypothetical protein IPP49_02840 [Saprospiraceae bacterium]|nr:hypothetical protein [Saprospiraceae bacterium]
MKYFQILVFISIISCQNSQNGKQGNKEEFKFFDEELGLISNKPTLNIYCQFSECGEWGGHEEHIVISKKIKNHLN